MKIHASNDFHRTSTFLYVKVCKDVNCCARNENPHVHVSKRAKNVHWQKLCGYKECFCGGALGERGEQVDIKYINLQSDGSIIIVLKGK